MLRQITHVRKNEQGDITYCYSANQWESEPTVIRNIESGLHSYYTEYGGLKADVKVVQGPYRKFLKSTPDGKLYNNLDYLPTA